MTPLMDLPRRRAVFYAGIVALLLGSMGLLAVKLVEVKMLPFDNKSEFQVVLDLPEGATLETSNAAAQAVAAYLRTVPEVVSTETYAGTAAPFNFNGLVRHYFMRRGANVADVQVNLLPKGERRRQSHDIAVAVRPAVDSIARSFGANAKIAEIPPGPPVLSTLVAEVYAADDSTRLAGGRAREGGHASHAGRGGRGLDRRGARRRSGRSAWTGCVPPRPACPVEQVAQVLTMALSGAGAGLASVPTAREGVAIVPRLGLADRSSVEALLAVPVATPRGPTPLARFVTVDSTTRAPLRMRKNLRPVIYVTGDVAGTIESPVYAILAMNQALDTVRVNGAAISALQRHRARRGSTRRPSSGTASGRSPSRCSATSASPSPPCWC